MKYCDEQESRLFCFACMCIIIFIKVIIAYSIPMASNDEQILLSLQLLL